MVATVRYGPDEFDGPDNFDEYFTFTDLFAFSRIAPPPFHARGCFWDLGTVVVTEHCMGPVLARRDQPQIMASPADHLTLVVIFDGELSHESEEVGMAGPGDVMLFDYARRFDYRSLGHSGASLSVARTLIESRQGAIGWHGLLPRTPETRLFADLMRSMVRQLPDLDQALVPTMAALAHQAMLAAIARQADQAPVESARNRALAYIEDQPPGTLDTARMASDLGLSRSKLYRLFEADGGVLAFDRRRRLHLLHLALLEEPASTPLTTLGARYGFFDGSTLARGFRSQFGYSMSTVRDHLSQRDGANAAAVEPLARFRTAFESLY